MAMCQSVVNVNASCLHTNFPGVAVVISAKVLKAGRTEHSLSYVPKILVPGASIKQRAAGNTRERTKPKVYDSRLVMSQTGNSTRWRTGSRLARYAGIAMRLCAA